VKVSDQIDDQNKYPSKLRYNSRTIDLPSSCKKYFAGSRPDLKVSYRDVSLSDSADSERIEQVSVRRT